ncbi:MAG: YcxB family protein [Kiritimatiellaeota bacterium]|nr:YcxB family protein [Kiritimatiellota bacterium]
MHRIEATYTEDDLVNFSCFVNLRLDTYRKPVRRTQVIFAFFAFLFLLFSVFFGVADGWPPSHRKVFFSIGTVFLTIMACMFPRIARDAQRKHIRKVARESLGDTLNTPVVVELRDDGVFTQSVRGQSTHLYSAINEITEHAGCVYVFVSKASAFIFSRDRVPKETLDAFVDELKARIARLKTETP